MFDEWTKLGFKNEYRVQFVCVYVCLHTTVWLMLLNASPALLIQIIGGWNWANIATFIDGASHIHSILFSLQVYLWWNNVQKAPRNALQSKS